jgi:fatty-acyl-CoA synthase
VPIISSGVVISTLGSGFQDAQRYIDLASKLGIPLVRVMCSGSPDKAEGDLGTLFTNYEQICLFGESKGVLPVLESNGFFCDTKLFRDFLDRVSSKNKGVIWDIHHTFRYKGEKPEESIGNLGKYIKHVHIKDSVFEKGEVVYKMIGDGDIPIKTAVDLLKKSGYKGFLSLELVRKWYKGLEDPSIVISQYIDEMKCLIGDI